MSVIGDTAAGKDADVAACAQALRYRAEGRIMREEAYTAQGRAAGMLARARRLRRHQWAILAAQVVVFALWVAMLWRWA